MSIIQGNAKQGSTRGFYNFPLEQSLRFNDDDSAYLSWTPASAGDQKIWTLSFWCKRANLENGVLFSSGTNSSNYFRIYFAGDGLDLRSTISGVVRGRVKTTAVYRDPSAWYHFVVSLDSTFATAAERMNVYVNGVLQDLTITNNFANDNHYWNSTQQQNIGVDYTLDSSSIDFYDGYLAEVNFIDGTALDADSFGELKNGVWIPKDPSGLTYGTNGFRLSFADDAEVEAFNTVLYRGNGGTQSVTGMGFQPDLVWIKKRGPTAASHRLLDSVRGVQKNLYSDLTSVEQTQNSVMSFDSDGVTVGDSAGTNGSGDTFVAWVWRAGGTPTVDNSAGAGNVPTAGSVKIDGVNSTSALAGTIPATRISASTTYGFSIVSYTGNGTDGATVGTGLNQTLDFCIVKSRDVARNWPVKHSALTGENSVFLNTTSESGVTGAGNVTFDATDTFTLNDGSASRLNINNNNEDYIAYCWTEKAGYSKFGSYAGDSTTDGSNAINVGFKPALVIIKHYEDTAGSYGGDWFIYDNTRNVVDGDNYLRANLNSAETADSGFVKLTDTGFALYTNSGSHNETNNNYIYAAFADTREAAFWLDQSGNDNDWQPVNLDHNDTVSDSPTDNFATLNPVGTLIGSPTFSEGNLKVVMPYNTDVYVRGTHGINSGKWYWEVTCGSVGSNAGIAISPITTTTGGSGAQFTGAYAYEASGSKRIGITASAYGASYAEGNVIGVAVDFDALEIEFYRDNVSQGAISISEGTYLPASSTGGAAESTFTYNFGQQPFVHGPPE